MLSQVFAKYRRSLQSIQEEPGVTAGPEAQDRREPHIDQFEEQENIRPATEAAFDRPVKKHKRSFTGRAKPSGPVLRDNRYAEEGQINKCCHGCKNPHLGNLSKGILVCRNKACRAGEKRTKYWCDTCIESKVCGKCDVGYSSFAECFEVVAGVPKQQDDWSCPHCSVEAGCPTPHCSSIIKPIAAPVTKSFRKNQHHTTIAAPAAELPACSEQLAAAEQQYSSVAEQVVVRNGGRVIIMPQFDKTRLKFKKLSAQGPCTLPVAVRQMDDGTWQCCGPTDVYECKPRGQCVHIGLVKAGYPFGQQQQQQQQQGQQGQQGPPDAPADQQREQQTEDPTHPPQPPQQQQHQQQEVTAEDAGEQHEDQEQQGGREQDEQQQHEDEEGGGGGWEADDDARCQQLLPTSDPLPPEDDIQTAPQHGIFVIASGTSSEPSAVHVLTVWQGHWRCYHSTHKDNTEDNMCDCMRTVLHRLGITESDVQARLQELQEEEEEKREQEGQQEQQHRRRRRTMLKLQQPYSSKPRMYRHAREPCLQQYYIPEGLRQLLQEQGLGQQLEAALRKPEPEDACEALEKLLSQATCGKHVGAQGQLQLYWGRTRISHVGDKQVQLAHIAMVNCCCTDDRCKFVYDGAEDGMFNLCNTELFSHYFLADLLDELHISGNSFNTMRERMLSREQRCTDDQPRHIISLPCLIRAFFGYVQLLTDLPVACCSICGTWPFGLIADGMSLQVFAKHLQRLAGVTQPTGATVPKQQVKALGTRKLFVKETRALLAPYSCGRMTQSSAAFTEEQLKQLLARLDLAARRPQPRAARGGAGAQGQAQPGAQQQQEQQQQPPSAHAALAALLRLWHPGLQGTGGGGNSRKWEPPAGARDVLYHLGSDTASDTALFKSQHAADALRQLMVRTAHDDAQLWHEQASPAAPAAAMLARDAPQIYRMVQALRSPQHAECRQHAEALLQCLLDLHHQHIGQADPQESKSVLVSSLPADDPAHSIIAQQEQLAWYPNWPLLYTRPRYEGLENEEGRSTEPGMYRKCDNTQPKVVSGQRKFNPGIFKVTCVHGVVYGFHFMKDNESPSDLFTLFLTRWPRHIPLAISWYDNACKFYEYTIKREPWLLKFMRAVVDSFHYGSAHQIPLHKCPRCFDTKAHSVAAIFNSQYEEHGNAYLSLFRGSLRSMALPRAGQLVETVLKCWGGKKMAKIRLELQAVMAQYQEVCRLLAWDPPAAGPAPQQ